MQNLASKPYYWDLIWVLGLLALSAGFILFSLESTFTLDWGLIGIMCIYVVAYLWAVMQINSSGKSRHWSRARVQLFTWLLLIPLPILVLLLGGWDRMVASLLGAASVVLVYGSLQLVAAANVKKWDVDPWKIQYSWSTAGMRKRVIFALFWLAGILICLLFLPFYVAMGCTTRGCDSEVVKDAIWLGLPACVCLFALGILWVAHGRITKVPA